MKKLEWIVLEDDMVAEAGSESFVILYDRYFSRVYNYLRYRCSDAAEADDLTAQVFLKALVNLDKYDPEKAPFDTWLFTIARNLLNDNFRKKRHYYVVDIEDVEHILSHSNRPLEEKIEHNEEKYRLLECIKTLTTRHRDLIALKFGANMTNRDIAKITGLSEQNVGVILHRGIKKLRKIMQEAEVQL
jgi:RNA polymerase sigma-70 factor (ECF subfamily)